MKKFFTGLLFVIAFVLPKAQWTESFVSNPTKKSDNSIYYKLDINALRMQLSNANKYGKNSQGITVLIPALDGKIEKYSVYSLSVMDEALAEKYQLGSYYGISLDNPGKTIRFSVAPNDFQSMTFSDDGYEFIEPATLDKKSYSIHKKYAKGRFPFSCNTKESSASIEKLKNMANRGELEKNSDKKFRTLRLAMSVTGEYTAYFGGTAGALAQINATLTRVNGVYEKDFNLHLNMINAPNLIFTNASTDPYSTASYMCKWNYELMNVLHGGTYGVTDADYDIGHLFGATGGGGNAGCIGCICSNTTTYTTYSDCGYTYNAPDNYKGSGITSPADGIPMGDNFDIDYVAHEMGHQLGANHTFSYKLEGTGVNVEPGSGSTIMGYAGITGSTDVQAHSDPYFHGVNIIQVQNVLTSATCDVETSITNTPPVIATLPAYTIPKSTAFVLTASATDAENDPITYCWEQVNSATTASTISNLGTLTNGPDFRSFNPTTSGTRYFPKLSTVLNGSLKSTTDWEAVSTVARATTFRVTVRDNNPDVAQQQTQSATQAITVGSAGPFKVTTTKVYNDAASSPITWDVVTTNAAPYNASDVKIDYTTDNGTTWTVLSASTPNDGTENISFAGIPTNTVIKLRVSAIGNVFYAVAPITVSATPLAAPDCATLSTPANNATNVDNTSVNLTWTAPTTGDVVDSYDVYLDQNPNPTTLVTNTTATSYAATGLLNNTTYYWKVISKNTVGSATGCTVFSFTTTPYCSAGATSTSYEKISNVTFSDINNNSTATAGYEDFTAITANVTKGTAYTFTASFTGTSYTSDKVFVWIDLNNDKDFDDAGEQVLATSAKKSPWTGTITIPATASTGTTRMRIRLFDSSLGPNTTPCGTSTYGQVEDYTLNIGVLATGETSDIKDIQIYPNPATDVLNITKVSSNASYMIFGASGQLLAKGTITDNKVPVSKLEKGVYMITIKDKDKSQTMKFIKK